MKGMVVAVAPVEAKVKASTVAAGVAGISIAVLNAVEADSGLIGFLPSWLQAVVISCSPAALVFLAGYRARHTPRSGGVG